MRRIVRVVALACALMGAGAFAQQLVPGSLHTAPFPGFANGNGKIPGLPVGASDDFANALALQPDGKIVLAGSCSNGSNSDFCIARFDAEGTLDASFDGPAGTGNGKFLLPIGAGDDFANALALQPDGKIVIAGACNNVGYDFCVARLNPDGTLDATFDGPLGNGNGAFLLPIGSSADQLNAVALQSDGKIVLAGHCSVLSGTAFCVARLHPDGSLDTSFDGPSGAGNGRFVLPLIGTTNDTASALLIQPDGKIVLAGRCSNGGNDDFCMARLNSDGALDVTFDGPTGFGNGKFLLTIGPYHDAARAALLQPDGRIVVAGFCWNNSSIAVIVFCAARLHSDGSLDERFGGPVGIGNGKFLLQIGVGDDRVNAVAFQSDGKIVLVGHCYNSDGSNDDFCLARLHIDGSLDASFDGPSGGSNGAFPLPIGAAGDYAAAVALQPDGRIVVAGYCSNGSNNDFCVARLNGGPSIASQCGFDIDGDGSVRATTDMLIGTRVALGMTGSAVIGGIMFPANATRNTWPLIRNYLVTQCGMTLAP